MNDRQEAPVIPLEILEQKYFMHKGLLMISFNRDQNREAKDSFIKALNIKPYYDIRIKKFCVEQLQKLYASEGRRFETLDTLAQSFKHVSRDFIFLVNQSKHEGKSMEKSLKQVRDTLSLILNNAEGAVESNDRISLITFAKNLRRIYTLVEKRKNFVQLKNQIEELKADNLKDQSANLLKALQEATKEFSEHDRTKKWIVCFTN